MTEYLHVDVDCDGLFVEDQINRALLCDVNAFSD